MLTLFAQLAAPPIQPGPARVPERQGPTRNNNSILLRLDNKLGKENENTNQQHESQESIELEGSSPYKKETLEKILEGCRLDNKPNGTEKCLNKLNAQLQKDGYINTRVITEKKEGKYKLIIIPGRLVEIRVSSTNKGLSKEIEYKLRPLLDQIFNIIQIKNALLNLERLGIASRISGSIGKLGSNPTKATLNIIAEVIPKPWKGLTSVSNDGNTGSGEWRGRAIAQKPDLLTRGDIFQFYGELNFDQDPELGAGIGSISYTYPLTHTWGVTGSFGASRRYLIEYQKPFRDISFRQYQGFIQTDWTFLQTTSTDTYAFAGISANHNNSYYKNEAFPVIAAGGIDGDLTSGYARIGLGHQGANNSLSWTAQIYGLQGINSFSSPDERKNLKMLGIEPGHAQAIGAYTTGVWTINQNLVAKTIAGGQYAFNPLTSSMGFSVGSDNGLRGLPGTLISGDSGWISNFELEWSFLKLKNNQFKLIPFAGAGGITTTRLNETFNDSVGSYGILLRWQHKDRLIFDLGWANQFNTDDNEGLWNDWIIGNGVYSKVTFQF